MMELVFELVVIRINGEHSPRIKRVNICCQIVSTSKGFAAVTGDRVFVNDSET